MRSGIHGPLDRQVLVRGSLVVIFYLLDTDESDSWLIGAIFFQFKASITHGFHLVGQNKLELTFANTITVHHNLKITINTILHCWIDLLVVVFCRSCDRIDAKASSPCPWCQQWIPIVVLERRQLPKLQFWIFRQAAGCIGTCILPGTCMGRGPLNQQWQQLKDEIFHQQLGE